MNTPTIKNYLQFVQNPLVRVLGRNPLVFVVNDCPDIHAFRSALLALQVDFLDACAPLLATPSADPVARRCLLRQLRSLQPLFHFAPDGSPSLPAIVVEERGKKDHRPCRSPPPGPRVPRRRPLGFPRARPLLLHPRRSRRRLPLPPRRLPGGAHPAHRRRLPLRQHRPHFSPRPPGRLHPPSPRPLPPPRPRQPPRRHRQGPPPRPSHPLPHLLPLPPPHPPPPRRARLTLSPPSSSRSYPPLHTSPLPLPSLPAPPRVTPTPSPRPTSPFPVPCPRPSPHHPPP